MKKKKDDRIRCSLFSVKGYIGYFVLVSFVCSCSFLLFYSMMERYGDDLRISSTVTFFNIVFLTFCICLFDGIRRKITIERPLRRILYATRKVTSGDFSVRIAPVHFMGGKNEFDVIIDDLNKMAEELSGVETLRTDFIANVSHELKTPLAVIRNYTEMLQDESLSPELRKEYSAAILTAVDRFTTSITNILRMNKLENQEIYPDFKEYELGEQLRACCLQFEDIWEQKGIQISTDIDDFTIHCDASLLEIVWNNLLFNALKFTEKGGKVTLSLKKNAGWAVVEISDTGCGIDLSSGTHIFDKFYQCDTSHAQEGNGLGLALVKKAIDIVGGEISVESVVDEGSTFTVKLPW